MQSTRERILNIIKERYEATVDELSEELGLTAVTVRHHLDILRGQGLVAEPVVRRRKSPGRPQYAYTLTETASAHFPKKYDDLANKLLAEIESRVPVEEMTAIMESIGRQIADEARMPEPDSFEARLELVVAYLNTEGYLAQWESTADAHYTIHIANCPFERVSQEYPEVCTIDHTLLTCLIGRPIERIQHAVSNGHHQCTYIIKAR
ncbi:MAG: ArsR family transcriptional regulator [Chloroflexi bacterium]|nr:ArsR family transcriptional regulator [Chloroflexota bacterium]